MGGMGEEGGERGIVRGRRNWEERRKGGGLEMIQRSQSGQERFKGSEGKQGQGRKCGGVKGKWRELREIK
jgi:hypothetical protein